MAIVFTRIVRVQTTHPVRPVHPVRDHPVDVLLEHARHGRAGRSRPAVGSRRRSTSRGASCRWRTSGRTSTATFRRSSSSSSLRWPSASRRAVMAAPDPRDAPHGGAHDACSRSCSPPLQVYFRDIALHRRRRASGVVLRFRGVLPGHDGPKGILRERRSSPTRRRAWSSSSGPRSWESTRTRCPRGGVDGRLDRRRCSSARRDALPALRPRLRRSAVTMAHRSPSSPTSASATSSTRTSRRSSPVCVTPQARTARTLVGGPPRRPRGRRGRGARRHRPERLGQVDDAVDDGRRHRADRGTRRRCNGRIAPLLRSASASTPSSPAGRTSTSTA